MRNVIQVLLVSVAAVVVLTGCPNLFGPSDEEVEEIMHMLVRAPADLGASLSFELVGGDAVFASADGSYVANQGAPGANSTGTMTFTAYRPPSSDMTISGSWVSAPMVLTATGFEVTSTGTLTIENGPAETLLLNIQLAATTDANGMPTGGTFTGNVTADGKAFDLVLMDLISDWLAGITAMAALT